jgi:hypothetical protein
MLSEVRILARILGRILAGFENVGRLQGRKEKVYSVIKLLLIDQQFY